MAPVEGLQTISQIRDGVALASMIQEPQRIAVLGFFLDRGGGGVSVLGDGPPADGFRARLLADAGRVDH